MKAKKISIILAMLIILFFTVFGKIIQQLIVFASIDDGCENVAVELDSAISDSSYSDNNYRTAYYNNLQQNYGNNVYGSCGYVALAMLLSYYDTFLSDSIVPEQYDVVSTNDNNNFVDKHNSPGTMYEDLNKSLGYNGYFNELSLLSDASLHSKLIMIGNDEGFVNAASGDYLTNLSERKTVLETYLNDVLGFTKGSEYKIDYISYETTFRTDSGKVKDYIISKIKEGYPVLIGVTNGSTGHACIAYDYDDSGNIYCNMGLRKDRTHITISQVGYSYYKSAMVIDFKLPHNHSNNYVTPDSSYCYCSENACIYNHVKKTKKIDSSQHTVSCACGISETVAHNTALKKCDLTYHYIYCKDCDYQQKELHRFLLYKVGNVTHEKCVCGQFKMNKVIAPILNYGLYEQSFFNLTLNNINEE